MVRLVINGVQISYGSDIEGLYALNTILDERRERHCLVRPVGPAASGVMYAVRYPDGGECELIYLTREDTAHHAAVKGH